MIDTLAAILQASAPIVLATLGGVFAARTGVWHLGLGGLISIGAMVAVVTAGATGSSLVAVAAAAAACCLVSALMWAMISLLKANAIIVGIGVTLLGAGAPTLAVVSLYGSQQTIYSETGLPKAFPGAEQALGQLSVLALATPAFVAVCWFVLRRTRFGLRLLAVGDHPFAARSAGISASRMQLWALLIAGIMCALAGAELALGSLRSFSDGMEAGRGLIAFAAVILGASQPLRASLAALVFGAISYFAIWSQITFSGRVPVEFFLMLPYLATIVGVVLTAKIRGGSATFSALEARDG